MASAETAIRAMPTIHARKFEFTNLTYGWNIQMQVRRMLPEPL